MRLLDDQQFQQGAPIGVVVGTGGGPCSEAEFSYGCFFEHGWKGVRPTTVPKGMISVVSGQLSLYFRLTGCNHIVSAACASGAVAMGQAYMLIKYGQERAVLCGGAEAILCPGMFAAWTSLRVLAKHPEPTKACRPFDKQRSGLVLSEGAAMAVFESLESAEQRDAEILAEVIGYGASSDAAHMILPSQQGQAMAIRRCLADARLEPDEVDYINAHGTSTEINDRIEAETIREVFGIRGQGLPVSSTKSMLGHSLGASAAFEFLVCVQAVRNCFVPPTLNCDEPDPDIGLDYVPNRGREHPVNVAMSNAFAFGGSNAILLLRRFTP